MKAFRVRFNCFSPPRSHRMFVRRLRSASKHCAVKATIWRCQHTAARLDHPSLSPESLADLYRRFGHITADIDPLRQTPQWQTSDNPLAAINGAALDTALSATYSAHIAYEFEHVSSDAERQWFIANIERQSATQYSPATRRNVYWRLLQSRLLDDFLSVKFPSFKRYGLEGAEAMIVAVQSILSAVSSAGTEQVVLAMPHRGRLNLIATLLDFPARAIFHKITGGSLIPRSHDGICDIISHTPHQVTKKFDQTHPLSVTLLANPSHLEAVNPVGLGYARALQDSTTRSNSADKHANKVVSLQLHGDAAFAGQGVVAESLQLSQLKDFTVGGTIHLIVNNQVGFTTFPHQARSTRYTSDVAHIVKAPVIHVNGDDAEAVMFAANIAAKYRQTFHRDIVIDLIGYRRLGHNEIDEPTFTQPSMYQKIKQHASVVTQYGETLQRAGLLDDQEIQKFTQKVHQHLSAELTAASTYEPTSSVHFQNEWKHMIRASTCYDTVSTGVDTQVLRDIATTSFTVPKTFTVHPRLQRALDARIAAVSDDKGAIDWATAEAIAVGSLLRDGYNVRLSGQDVQRGTFSQRHFTLTDQQTNDTITPLKRLTANSGASLAVVNSNLSEFGVVGFEYGYSWFSPRTLNVWEAQFGDFANGAQVIIDQFIANGESKWLKSSGLVILLPHGMDGAASDHSSGRLERFLQASDDQTALTQEETFSHNKDAITQTQRDRYDHNPVNMIIVNPTTPAQYFHLLRRQMLRNYRKPLIVMSPKSLLRHNQCFSAFEQFNTPTTFQPILVDFDEQTHIQDRGQVRVMVLLSGKAYYDIRARRQADGRKDIAIIRFEELSPFPYEQTRELLSAKYTALQHIVWFQEEHANAGAWSYVQPRLNRILSDVDAPITRVKYVGRRPLCASAVGNSNEHKQEVKDIYNRLFQL